MKAVILAAGISKRLRPLTNKIPKCLLNVNGEKFLERTISSISESELFNEIIIVVGHGKNRMDEFTEKFNECNIKLIYNEKYKEWNNCYSLYKSLIFEDDFVLFNSDVLFDFRLIKKIVSADKTSLLIDNIKQLTNESMKVKVRNEKILGISKKLPNTSYGEYIGIAKIKKADKLLLRSSLEKVTSLDPTNFYEEGFQRMMNKNFNFGIVNTDGLKWIEVDDFNDLEKAKKMF
jgi:choline kinase